MSFKTSHASILRSWCFCLLLGSVPVLGQQFTNYGINFAYDDMSQACVTALNTTVSCSPILAAVADELPRLKAEDLSAVCLSSCLTSLQSVKQTIAQSCTENDIMTVYGQPFPATYMVDYFIYSYSLMCRRDSSTQEYCDVLFAEWLNEGPTTAEKRCSDCALGAAKIQLDSPFAYDDEFASQFESLTSSCSKTSYAFTKPAPYTVSTSASGTTTTSGQASTPTYDSSCITLHTIEAGDTCNSIAVARNVSSFAVYGPNGITDCSNLPSGKRVCLLGECKRYKVKSGDSCDAILAANGVQVNPQVFVVWNPNIDSLCRNIEDLVDEEICLSRPEGLLNPELSNDYSTPTATAWPAITPSAEVQLPAAPGTIDGCKKYINYQVISVIEDRYYAPQYVLSNKIANDCSYVSEVHGVKLADFLTWNPSLSANATSCKLGAGFSYCIDHPNKGGDPGLDACEDVPDTIIPAGTISSCSCFKTYGGNESGWLFCSTFQNAYDLTESELKRLNSWLGSTCDTDLFSNLPETSSRAICISGGGSASSTISGSSIRSTSSASLSSSITTQGTSTSKSTTNPPSTTGSSTTSSVSSSSTTSGSVCISGVGDGNYGGLCDYTCHLGYCPSDVCTCLTYGEQVPVPDPTFPNGYPAPGLDDSYSGLCSFTCLRGYCPSGACTYTAP